MAIILLRPCLARSTHASASFLLWSRSVCSRTRERLFEKQGDSSRFASAGGDKPISRTSYLEGDRLVSDHGPHLDVCDIEIVDSDVWRVSSSLSVSFRGYDHGSRKAASRQGLDGEVHDDDDRKDAGEDSSAVEHQADFDELDNMRIYGNLFYKIDRGSKEFEEYSYDFHRKKSSKRKDYSKEREVKKETLKNAENQPEPKRKESLMGSAASKSLNDGKFGFPLGFAGSSGTEKKKRTPTFNQLTAPYHLPFCLDIYISKSSVRACIVHRVTSKVVAVAHSISKDMKFDLASTRNVEACAAVGAILAQRALADDIHDVVYTPRKGERLEGKLQVVLQAVIDNGVNVKVKLRQRKTKKSSRQQFMAF